MSGANNDNGDAPPPLHPLSAKGILREMEGVPRLHNTIEMPPPPLTSAVTRSWSDVDPRKLMMTFAATSFTYSFFGQPLFLIIARQQCSTTHVSARKVLRDVMQTHGLRGLYRGAGAAITGTVLSELVYYFVVEYWKEKLPLQEREWRSFGAGLLADLGSTPVFNPFAVISQVQMVAGCSFSAQGHNYMSAWGTTVTLVREQGVSCLLRGTVLTMVVAPLTGAWWFVYESFKRMAYGVAPGVGARLSAVVPQTLQQCLPHHCTSTTDNVLVNAGVGAAASMVIGVVMNPIYVLRLRLQVGKRIVGVRFPLWYIMSDVLRNEGARALWKGLGGNLLVGVVGGCAFGFTYEGAKEFSDITQSTSG
ncbi:putative mitochondrial mitochondrial carrier protein (MCP19) [Leptomonas pyrrhocoris]|uniref:Putative mitochondrial mitochondrial carrier protein (MCP19) n=1 Tax=Leptomonas pyrrhocoris TaxID=157538 RepID=A0A0M9G3U3_LEPPY|nr:putative mitochondrial mitochondrial carrier protein (MCP19) [Leptomonas pyrrhocoris]KPA81860.1 putative mitochondrial mitochondrial carrier protein (MCP19) [Leptomonas pyrrhocoris]|eukprot:XP_015660299.1 putative mitochondrial mitochondrial carrier protein (MCP19) [Leptomonas pyrrhocoris]